MMNVSIVGSGKIAKEIIKMLRTEAEGIGITSLYSHSNSPAAHRLAQENGIPTVYNDYTQLLSEDKADFLYIALVNSAHYDYVKLALLAGRNVIVEKPFCLEYDQAKELVDMARERQLYLFEAVSLLHTPNFKFVSEQLKNISPVRLVMCNYSQYSSRYDRYLKGDVAPAFNPALGGGALMDLNVYNLNAMVGLFGRPVDCHYFANRGFNGVDTSGIAVLNYDSMKAVCSAAKDCAGPSSILIEGERGTIRVVGAPNEFAEVEITKDGRTQNFRLNKYSSRLTHEFMEFSEIWERKDYSLMSHYQDLSLQVMEVLSALRQN